MRCGSGKAGFVGGCHVVTSALTCTTRPRGHKATHSTIHLSHTFYTLLPPPAFYFPFPIFFSSGHGTFWEDGKLVASVAGVVERINKVISVRPARSR